MNPPPERPTVEATALLTRRVQTLEIALSDAISTYREDTKKVLVSAERIEAWKAALSPAPKL